MSYENKEIYTNEPKRIWKQGNNPYRSIVFGDGIIIMNLVS